jgi:hypothetical protein
VCTSRRLAGRLRLHSSLDDVVLEPNRAGLFVDAVALQLKSCADPPAAAAVERERSAIMNSLMARDFWS